MPTPPSSDASATPTEGSRPSRRIGSRRGSESGPLLLCVASLHGNEPSGIHALTRVLKRLEDEDIPIRGDFVGLRGNLGALEAGKRFLDEDMNRVWQSDRVAAVLESLRSDDPAEISLPMVGSAELNEQRELLAALREEARRARGRVSVIDLHTTSSESAPFTTLGDTLQNRDLALRLPVPAVLGLEEQIDGAMLQYFDGLGWRGMGIEAGQHDAPDSVDAHEEAIWLLLTTLGLVDPEAVPDLHEIRERFAARATDLPRVVDVRHRHGVGEADAFAMHPGFLNFERVRAGQELGQDRSGKVNAPLGGRIFLPLYQPQGDDGFFIVRGLNPTWLRVSRALRIVGADRLATWIPGVSRHPDRVDAVVLGRMAQNRVAIGLLHLMGFNVRREEGPVLMVRRPETPELDPVLDLRL